MYKRKIIELMENGRKIVGKTTKKEQNLFTSSSFTDLENFILFYFILSELWILIFKVEKEV